MNFHALAIDDMPTILEDVKDRLESIGHTCDGVLCLEGAREILQKNHYAYVLLDLEIPFKYGRPSRIQNGQNLIHEIRATRGYEDIPIIVMTSHGHDSAHLAVDVMRGNGATDYVQKPFPDKGRTLEKAILDALAVSGRSRPGAATHSSSRQEPILQPFEEGTMVFFKDRVELCEVKICGGPESGIIRRILDELKHKNTHGQYRCHSGDELAQRVGCDRGQCGIAEAVRNFRDHLCNVMLEKANIKLNRLHDIISNDRRYGYRLSKKITAHNSGDPVNDLVNEPHDVVNDPLNYMINGQDDPRNNQRQQWIMTKLQANGMLRKSEIADQFKCSKVTAQRDLRDLRRRGQIEFIGPAKTGCWRRVANQGKDAR